jgi:hypothetical protein
MAPAARILPTSRLFQLRVVGEAKAAKRAR